MNNIDTNLKMFEAKWNMFFFKSYRNNILNAKNIFGTKVNIYLLPIAKQRKFEVNLKKIIIS